MVNLPPPCTSDKDAHPASANDGGVDSRFRPCRKRFSRLALGALFSLFAPRVFHNSCAIKALHTLSQKCRGVTLQFPFWELFAGHNAERPLFSSFPFISLHTLPSSVSCKFFPCHSYENCRVCTNSSHFETRSAAGLTTNWLSTIPSARIASLQHPACLHASKRG